MAHIPAERCLGIIELLAQGACELPLGEIAERLDLPKSGAHRLLATLVDLGWVAQNQTTGFYHLTMHLAVLGQRFYAASGIPDLCQPLIDKLATDCGEFARLAVVGSDALVWIAYAQGATEGLIYHPVSMYNSFPLYATASGKAWLATLGKEEGTFLTMRSGGFEQAGKHGPNVIRTVEELLKELEATTQRGYGLAVNEAEAGVAAIASAIRLGQNGETVGTVSIAGPSVRMTDERIAEIAPLVTKCAAELSTIWPLRTKGFADSSVQIPNPHKRCQNFF